MPQNSPKMVNLHNTLPALSRLAWCISLVLLSLTACSETDDDTTCTLGDTDAQGNSCVCTLDTGAACDPSTSTAEDGCMCEFVGETPYPIRQCSESVCAETQPSGFSPSPYRFVLVEDLTQNASGTSPGADIDAIVVTRADGTVMPATTVEDLGGIGEGDFTDPNNALGLPNSNCEVENFVALGGADAGGYIVVGFADDNHDGSFTSGSVTVHEIGSTMCPDNTYDDDPYSVSISISKDLSSFVEIATDVLGNNPIPVPEISVSDDRPGINCTCP